MSEVKPQMRTEAVIICCLMRLIATSDDMTDTIGELVD
jgi:hypothetical protein